jgi:hypothetical protein
MLCYCEVAIVHTLLIGQRRTIMSQKLRLDIDQESYARLAAIAIEERRPLGWQAEVLLMQAIATYFTPMLRPERQDQAAEVDGT